MKERFLAFDDSIITPKTEHPFAKAADLLNHVRASLEASISPDARESLRRIENDPEEKGRIGILLGIYNNIFDRLEGRVHTRYHYEACALPALMQFCPELVCNFYERKFKEEPSPALGELLIQMVSAGGSPEIPHGMPLGLIAGYDPARFEQLYKQVIQTGSRGDIIQTYSPSSLAFLAFKDPERFVRLYQEGLQNPWIASETIWTLADLAPKDPDLFMKLFSELEEYEKRVRTMAGSKSVLIKLSGLPDLDKVKFTTEQISYLFEQGINSYNFPTHEAAYQLLGKFSRLDPDETEKLYKKGFYHKDEKDYGHDYVREYASCHLGILAAVKPEVFLALYKEAKDRYLTVPLNEYNPDHHPLIGSLASLAGVDQALFEDIYNQLLQKAINEPLDDSHMPDYVYKIIGTLDGLTLVNPQRAAGLIRDHLNHPNRWVREAAGKRLEKLFSQNPQLAWPLYIEGLENENEYLRVNTACSLKGLAQTNPDLFTKLYQQGRRGFPHTFNNTDTIELLYSLIPINPELAASVLEQTNWQGTPSPIMHPNLLAEFFAADPKIGIGMCAKFMGNIQVISQFLAKPAARSFFEPLRVLLVEQLKIAPAELNAAISLLNNRLTDNLDPEGLIAEDLPNLRTLRILSEKVRGNQLFSKEFKKMFAFEAERLETSVIGPAGLEAIEILLDYGFFPTPLLRQYLANQGIPAIDELVFLAKETQKGFFDPNNQLQKELEFAKYLKLSEDAPEIAYDEFQKLGFFEKQDVRVLVSPHERKEAQAAAYEAERVFRLVENLIQGGRKVIVIGNRRYGAYYVTQPLKDYFDQLVDTGLLLETYTSDIKSSSAGSDSPFYLFADPLEQSAFMTIVQNKHPDIVFVDGTPNLRANGLPRMPKSMMQALNWVSAYNRACEAKTPLLVNYIRQFDQTAFQEAVTAMKKRGVSTPYRIRHFTGAESQDVSDEIYIGDEMKMGRSDPTFTQDGNPQLILVNSACDPINARLPHFLENHKPGFFDDLDNHLEVNYALTETGVQKLYQERTEEWLLSAIQEIMRQKLQSLIY